LDAVSTSNLESIARRLTLSDGLHLRSDEHCLEIASSIRVILAELSERLAQALKDEAELNKALSRLMAKK